MPIVRIDIPGPLQELVGGAAEVTATGATVGAALNDVGRRHATLLQRVLTRGGAQRPHVNLFLNDHDVRAARGLDTPLNDGDVLVVVPSVAGG